VAKDRLDGALRRAPHATVGRRGARSGGRIGDEGAERSRHRQGDAADDQGGEPVVAAEEAHQRTLIGEEVLHDRAEDERSQDLRDDDEEVEEAQATPTPTIDTSSRYLLVTKATETRPTAPVSRQSPWVSRRPSRSATTGSAKEKAKQTAEYIAKQLPPQAIPCS